MAKRKYCIACIVFIIIATVLHIKVMQNEHAMTYSKATKLAGDSDLSNSDRAVFEQKIQKAKIAIKTTKSFEYGFVFIGLLFWFISFRKKEPVFNSIPLIAIIAYVMLSCMVM